jgi:hypothetical protein
VLYNGSTIMNPVVWVIVILAGLVGFCLWRIWAQGLRWATAKRWLLTVALALLIIGVFMGSFFYANHKGLPDELFVKWMNILLTAAVAFGTVIKAFWQCRQRAAFWAELCVLMAAHFLILQRLRWTTGGYFWLPIVVGLPEIFVVFILLGVTLQVTPTPQK